MPPDLDELEDECELDDDRALEDECELELDPTEADGLALELDVGEWYEPDERELDPESGTTLLWVGDPPEGEIRGLED